MVLSEGTNDASLPVPLTMALSFLLDYEVQGWTPSQVVYLLNLFKQPKLLMCSVDCSTMSEGQFQRQHSHYPTPKRPRPYGA